MVAEVVQPQAFVANIDNATSGMNMSSHLPQNTTIDNENLSATEEINKEQTSPNNRTESENMTQQQQGQGASNGQSNSTDDTGGGGNMTNQSQQQQQQVENNPNPLSKIPILGEPFG